MKSLNIRTKVHTCIMLKKIKYTTFHFLWKSKHSIKNIPPSQRLEKFTSMVHSEEPNLKKNHLQHNSNSLFYTSATFFISVLEIRQIITAYKTYIVSPSFLETKSP